MTSLEPFSRTHCTSVFRLGHPWSCRYVMIWSVFLRVWWASRGNFVHWFGSYAVHTPKMLLPCSSFSWFMLFTTFHAYANRLGNKTIGAENILENQTWPSTISCFIANLRTQVCPRTWKCHSGSRPSLWFLQWGMGQRRGWQIPFFCVAHMRIGFGQQESKYIY